MSSAYSTIELDPLGRPIDPGITVDEQPPKGRFVALCHLHDAGELLSRRQPIFLRFVARDSYWDFMLTVCPNGQLAFSQTAPQFMCYEFHVDFVGPQGAEQDAVVWRRFDMGAYHRPWAQLIQPDGSLDLRITAHRKWFGRIAA